MSENDKNLPEVIYAVEGPINPRSGAPTLYRALGEPQAVRDLRSELEEARHRIAELEAAIKPFAEIARTFGPRCSDSDKAHGPITVGDLRAAHRAMIKAEKEIGE